MEFSFEMIAFCLGFLAIMWYYGRLRFLEGVNHSARTYHSLGVTDAFRYLEFYKIIESSEDGRLILPGTNTEGVDIVKQYIDQLAKSKFKPQEPASDGTTFTQ